MNSIIALFAVLGFVSIAHAEGTAAAPVAEHAAATAPAENADHAAMHDGKKAMKKGMKKGMKKDMKEAAAKDAAPAAEAPKTEAAHH